MILFCCLLCVCLNAQNPNLKKGEIGITFTPVGNCGFVQFGKGGSSKGKLYGFGVNYIYSLNKRLELETGIEYSKYHIIQSPEPNYKFETNLYLINIPLTLRINFLKFFYFNTGIFIDIDFSKGNEVADNQTGLGFMLLGLGAKYDFKSGVSLFANPFVRWHSVIHFVPNSYPGTTLNRLGDIGVRFGITYNLKNERKINYE